MCFINEQEPTDVLAIGSSDGVVRVWKNFFQPHEGIDMVASWLCFNRIPSPQYASSRGAGLIIDWDPFSRHLVSSIDAPGIRVWDLEKGIAVIDSPIPTKGVVTHIVCFAFLSFFSSLLTI